MKAIINILLYDSCLKGVRSMAFDKVKEIVVEQLGVEENEGQWRLLRRFRADSLDIVELIMALVN